MSFKAWDYKDLERLMI